MNGEGPSSLSIEAFGVPRSLLPTPNLEKFVEPFTGMPLLGVGGYGPEGVTSVDLLIDGAVVLTLTPDPVTRHFAGHVPCDDANLITVVGHVAGQGMATWFEAGFEAVPWRGSIPPPKPSFLRRVRIRLGRMSRWAKELPEKIEYRLWKRRFRPAPWYDTFSAAATPNAAELERMRTHDYGHRIVISILCPVFNVDPKWLRKAVESVRSQPYPHWELCLADDASTNANTKSYLKSLVGIDERIKVVFRETNGHICAATNSAAELATGEFIALMDNDDELAIDALAHVAFAIRQFPHADLLYSDEDKIDALGHRYDPQFKPDWSPELLLSYNYINHFTVIRRSLFERVGRFRVGYEGSQDHDLLLRVTEQTKNVIHIPRVLYHWRSLPSSTAASAGVKQYVHDSGRKAVTDACLRRCITATIEPPSIAKQLNLPILSFTGPDEGPSVAAIVTGSNASKAIDFWKANTRYRDVVFVSNPTDTAAGRNAIAALQTAEILAFLDDTLRGNDPAWLSKLVANLRPGVGVVGPRIMNTDGSIRSAGVVMNLRDGCGPVDAFAGVTPRPVTYYFYAEVTRNVSAVRKSCLVTTKNTFQTLNGFDSSFTTAYDLDYCRRGQRCLAIGNATVIDESNPLFHDDPRDVLRLGRDTDPFHNPNLSRARAFELNDEPAPSPFAIPTPARKTLVFAHNLAAAEGAPRYLSELIVGLTQSNVIEPTIFCGQGGAGEKAYHDHGIRTQIVARPWNSRIIDGLWTRDEYRLAIRAYRDHLVAERPTLVIVNTLLGFPMIEAAAREKIPTLWIIHESYSTDVLNRVWSPFAKGRCEAAFALADRIVPCSHDTASLFRHLDVRQRIRVRHNMIDPAEIDSYCAANPKTDSPVTRFVAVGTICERKGQHTIVEAAALLKKQNQSFVVDLVGARPGIPYLDYVRQLITRHDLHDYVRLIPETESKPYFHKADVYVNASHMETYSRSMLEAMAFGLPIISTTCQGVGEQVAWGQNALPFRPGDAEGLSKAMGELLTDSERRDSMSAASRAQFECHPPFEKMIAQFAELIRV